MAIEYVYPDGTVKAALPNYLLISGVRVPSRICTAEEIAVAGYAAREAEVPVPTLEDAKAAKASQIATAAEAALADLGREYCRTERDTWDQQYAEAQAYQADAEADVPLLDAIAGARGQAVADLAAAIVANRAAWVVAAGNVVGQRLALQDQVDVAASVAEVEAISVSITLAT